ncbi:MAG: beta-phosphoglucomutase family hydrolase [Bacteroidales bacterium]|nr:beta-phosphoglucomutase family hydrolase [Bacteroidales bacterium]
MHFELPPNTKGLIFDLDGTLADTMPYHFEAWQSTCRKYGIDLTSRFLRAHTGVPAWAIAKDILDSHGVTGIDPKILYNEKIAKYRTLQHKVKAVEPVTDIVRKYYKKLPMAVGTGGHKEAVMSTLENIGMTDYFSIIVTANDVTNHKPHPETFLKCAELINVDPAHIIVFEDGDLGIEAAINAGMTPVDVRGWYDNRW